ncbi:MAG TPA: PLP-dependent aspartate aminotransferase family protein [Fimbriimonadales bacterium]|nr:PLP-dependent aspartate aminotransferase family protein [Fimbriimonadales bacterium]
MSNSKDWEFETICQRFAEEKHFAQAVVPPIFQNSLFVYEDAEKFSGRTTDPDVWDYTRVSNPTIRIAERKIAALEKADDCRLFSSGMAAISAAILSCTRINTHVICTNSAYGPTRQFLSQYLSRFGIETTFVDGKSLDAIREAIRPNTSLIYLETPGSMFFDIQDIEGIVAIAKTKNIATILDNSNASPYFQNPIEFGVDLVVHSATKYLGGHSDLIAGAVCGSLERMSVLRNEEGLLLGAILDPFAAWLLIRSLRTLALRMERHQANALRVAQFLESHPKVRKVFYPGLDSHEGRELVKKQMRGTSGLLSFQLKDASRDKAFALCNNLKLFRIGCSWGGHESLVIPFSPPSEENAPEEWFLRSSIGLENAEDLIKDLSQALKKI